MSSVYVLEPPTRGKVILHTSCGPLDIELWSKEAPKACRNFVQLCMEKYYDKTIFHRIISDFMVQGGDHTGTGQGGESIYGEPFADEFHTRLRFRQRGFVACANAGQKDSNNSQFFITLDRCEWLTNKHTLFGKVTGDTIYNLLKIAESEIGKDDRPLEPPSIISCEVLWNPFDDIVPRVKRAPEPQEVKKAAKPKKKLNLLSFGEEALQEEVEIAATSASTKIKSSHDVLDDPRLLKGAVMEEDEGSVLPEEPKEEQNKEEEEERRRKERQMAVRQALAGKAPVQEADSDDEMSLDEKMRQQILEKRKLLGKPPKVKASSKKPKSDDEDEGEEEDETTAHVRRDKLVMKKKGVGSEARAEMEVQKDADLQLLSPLEQQRQRYKLRKRVSKDREEKTLEMFKKFKQHLAQDSELSSHKLQFSIEEDKKADDYVVVDPLIEKGKEKFNKLQARMKRREREWAGKSLT